MAVELMAVAEQLRGAVSGAKYKRII